MPILLVDENGQLTGAQEVSVDGQLYDVTFLDGTCADVFGACETTNFVFQTIEDSEAAAQALLDQVFVDSVAGLFDSMPSSTLGCENSGGCTAWTPYDLVGDEFVQVVVYYALNDATDVQDRIKSQSIDQVDTSEIPTSVWAVWNPKPVPEPGTLALYGIGLAGMGLARRRKRA